MGYWLEFLHWDKGGSAAHLPNILCWQNSILELKFLNFSAEEYTCILCDKM